jgi:hypothetical protein
MKKNYILGLALGLCLLLGQTESFAQFRKGNVIVNPGIGLGYYYGGASYASFAAGFSVNAEFSCILDEIAIGPYVAVTRRSYDYIGDDYNYTFIDFGARGTYHFAKLLKVNNEKFDPYAGVFLGFVATSDNYDGNSIGYSSYGGRAQGGIYAGARWFFTDKFGAFGEVGVGMYPVFLGLTFKLK